MSINRLLRSVTTAMIFIWLSFGPLASYSRATLISTPGFYQDRKGKKQDRGKENKKPEVKEVPQSRKQGKPEEVKPDKKEKSSKDTKKRKN